MDSGWTSIRCSTPVFSVSSTKVGPVQAVQSPSVQSTSTKVACAADKGWPRVGCPTKDGPVLRVAKGWPSGADRSSVREVRARACLQRMDRCGKCATLDKGWPHVACGVSRGHMSPCRMSPCRMSLQRMAPCGRVASFKGWPRVVWKKKDRQRMAPCGAVCKGWPRVAVSPCRTCRRVSPCLSCRVPSPQGSPPPSLSLVFQAE
jgi:hypothetical protein